MAEAPVIDTPRLRLRGHRIDDLDARVALGTDPGFVRVFGEDGGAREECWTRLQRYVGHWALLGWGMFAVEDRATGRLMGEVGLGRFERGLGPRFESAPEAAWALAGPLIGRNFAFEAFGAVLEWYERTFGATRLVCMIPPANDRSIALAERLGFSSFAQGRYHDRPVTLFERQPLAPVAQAR